MVGYYFTEQNNNQSNILYMEETASPDSNAENEKQSENQIYSELKRPEVGLSTLLGKQTDALKNLFGEPNRIDPTPYGYEWWVYNDVEQYMQVGVEGGKIVTLYALGEKVDITPFKIGETIEEIFSSVLIETEINLKYEGTSYRFEMSEEDMNSRPLVKMGDIFVQLNIDKFTGSLSSVRIMDSKTLIAIRPYELVYRGELLVTEPISEEVWTVIEEGNKKQLFDMTNILRKRYRVNELKWDDELATVAYLHSKDMYDSDNFSHTSEEFGELSDRLDAANLLYEIAGENIAANYLDAPAVMGGWLNSEHHRESLLNRKFTHIGIGVYHKLFTQNFIQKKDDL
jgi:uncharacterized protein YkwD